MKSSTVFCLLPRLNLLNRFMVLLIFYLTTGRFSVGAVVEIVILVILSDYLLDVSCDTIFFLLKSGSKSN